MRKRVELSGPSLARVNVKLLDKINVRLKCMACGLEWEPGLTERGNLPYFWWKCPKGCNDKANIIKAGQQ